MTPDERQLLSGLFDRIRNGANQQRDHDAETFISDAVRAQPYAPYLLSQTVIVQEQALRAASDRLQELENKVKALESGAVSPQGGDTSFLGGLGRSIFGTGQPQPQQAQRASVPSAGYAPQPSYSQGQPGGFGAGGAPQGGPWGQMGGGQPQGGGFLKGALGAAAGVAGGVLLANSISGLFHGGNNPFGIASGMGGFGGGNPGGGGETVVNNYYEGDGSGGGNFDNGSGGSDQGFSDSNFDNGGDAGSGSDDGDFNV